MSDLFFFSGSSFIISLISLNRSSLSLAESSLINLMSCIINLIVAKVLVEDLKMMICLEHIFQAISSLEQCFYFDQAVPLVFFLMARWNLSLHFLLLPRKFQPLCQFFLSIC